MSAAAKPGYQPDQASAKIGAAVLLGVLALIAVSAALVYGMYHLFHVSEDRPAPPGLETAPLARLGPQLQSIHAPTGREIEASARARLEAYGWTDRSHGNARIPIERAMALQAQHGWPDRKADQ